MRSRNTTTENTRTPTHITGCQRVVSRRLSFRERIHRRWTLERHELSSVFGDMAEDDFENLKKSVENDGFMDPLIRMHDGKVLDGCIGIKPPFR